MIKCLIVDKLHDSIFSLMEGIGVEADYRPELKREEILRLIGNYQGIIIRSKTQIDREFLQAAEQLEWVARAGAGIDQLDMQALEERGITVLNAPEGNSDALAEHCIGLILAVLNKFRLGDRQIGEAIWDREGNRGNELGEMTVGIIGYGYMGKAVCKRLSSFGCKVIGYDKYLENYSDQYIEEQQLEDLFSQCDLLSLHVPLTDETRGWVDTGFLNSFKKPIFVINTARGEILDLKSLVNSLEDGKVVGAGLDVLQNEKPDSWDPEFRKTIDYLHSHSRVILTPHVGGWSVESYRKINEVLIEKIKSLIKN